MSRSMLRRRSLVAAVLLGTIWPVLGEPAAVDRALLAGNWRAVTEALGAEQPDETGWRTVLRGHAALALNRNDDSTRHFLAASASAALTDWDMWTTQHLGRHTQSSVAWYLRGDALARREAWGGAADAFARAIELEGRNSLAWNARGVVHALKGRWKEAGDDFAAAIARQPELADPYANAGAAYVLQSIGRKETLRRTFDEALRRSPSFRLAKVGAGAMQFGIGEWDAAVAALEAQAAVKDPIGALAASNLAVVRFGQREAMRQAGDGELVAGTSVTVQAGSRAPSRLDTLNQDILANEIGAIAPAAFAKWSKDGVSVLSSIGKASGLGFKPAQVMNPLGRIAAAFETGIRLGTSGSAEAAARMKANAAQSEKEFRTEQITLTMNNFRRNPGSEGFRNAATNWLNSAHSGQAREIAHQAGLQPKQLDALVGSMPKAGGAILSFQRAYTSRGGWGMYLPFGLVYTGFDPGAGGAGTSGSGHEADGTTKRR